MGGQPHTPIMVKEVPPPSAQTGAADVLIGSFGLAGLLLVGALVTGAIVGFIVVRVKRWRDSRGGGNPETEFVRLNL
ncbi:MAG: hypothetical protein ACRD2X_23590 [Vicinamibacteraceae bacterium]